ncbi:hypothetical protein [Anaeromyxobacter oryzae]|uniref:Uncharacterized protein n=1 Tax=Anaeromyxobacter oryzae TaxID=2918170 RepID=A0ABM7WQ43_9BACT|nr:hypothetical protein [Anaeromyxobacter oryzae]BDG01589.1 hypothetical protein AMOR_05850 [Anaeromyxobacter oryzae]
MTGPTRTDVTQLLLRYREAARHLWNCFLREPETFAAATLAGDDARDDWEELKQVLFRAIVLRNTGSADHAAARLRWLTPIDFLHVTLRVEVPAMVSRKKDQGSYWDHPVDRLDPDDDLRFIDFYDFDESRHRDFQYCQAEIRNSQQHPEVIGHIALVEVQYVNVVVEDPASP